jgi:hypothetical protein
MFGCASHQGDPGPVVLTDPCLEHSSTVKAMLDVIYRYETPPLHKTTLILYLIDLADKWDVPLVHKVLKTKLEAAFFRTTAYNFELFLLAIKLNEIHIAAALIERKETADGHEHDWSSSYKLPPCRYYDRFAPGTWRDVSFIPRLYHIESCEYHYFIQLPPKIAWALQRASMMWDHGLVDGFYLTKFPPERQELRKKSIAEHFRRIMDPKCRWTPLSPGPSLISDRPQKPSPAGSRGFALGNGKD